MKQQQAPPTGLLKTRPLGSSRSGCESASACGPTGRCTLGSLPMSGGPGGGGGWPVSRALPQQLLALLLCKQPSAAPARSFMRFVFPVDSEKLFRKPPASLPVGVPIGDAF